MVAFWVGMEKENKHRRKHINNMISYSHVMDIGLRGWEAVTVERVVKKGLSSVVTFKLRSE